jgi:hypothetical protein
MFGKDGHEILLINIALFSIHKESSSLKVQYAKYVQSSTVLNRKVLKTN